MGKMKTLISILIVVIAINITAKAGVGGEMEKLYKSFGGGANVNKGGAYHTQSGGYYTGGSFYARVPNRTLNPFNLQPPRINSGCGIDMFAGSFSHIKFDELVKHMRNVMGAGAGYAFNLALQEYVPTIYNTMNKLSDIAREINNISLSTCDDAAIALGSVVGQTEASSKVLCSAIGRSNNKYSDHAQAKQKCGGEGENSSINKQKTKEYEDQLGDEFNIAWKAIKKGDGLGSGSNSDNKGVAELLMSISGTIIAKQEGSGKNAKLVVIPYASLTKDDSLIDMLLYGENKGSGKATIYKCSDDECLNMKEEAFTINKTEALVPKIEKMLRSMSDKARNHTGALTAAEKSLVELTQIPIIAIIAVQNGYMVGNAVMNVNEFVDSIAYDYVLGYLERQLDYVEVNLKNLEKVQMSGKAIESFKKDIAEVRRVISTKKFGAYQRMHATISVIEKSKLMETKVESMFYNYNEVKS
jgi:conjugative transfer pilus assembly protein TraH